MLKFYKTFLDIIIVTFLDDLTGFAKKVSFYYTIYYVKNFYRRYKNSF